MNECGKNLSQQVQLQFRFCFNMGTLCSISPVDLCWYVCVLKWTKKRWKFAAYVCLFFVCSSLESKVVPSTHTHIVIEMKMKERKSVTFIHSSALVCYRCRSKVGIYLVSRTYFHKYVCSVSTGAGRPSITNTDKSQWMHHHTHTMYWTIRSIFMWPTGSLWSVVDSCAKFNLIWMK